VDACVEDGWHRCHEHAANEAFGEVECEKPWKPRITLEMIEKMDERTKWINVNMKEGRKKYKSLNNQLQ